MQQKKRETSYFSPYLNKSEVNYTLNNNKLNKSFQMRQKKKNFKDDINNTVDNINLKH